MITTIRDILPSANCGACGFVGCDAFAKAVVNKNASVSSCSVGGVSVAKKIASILGIEATEHERKVSYIKCGGNCENAQSRYLYQGLNDCHAAMQLAAGGSKSCSFGCLGEGSCMKVCPFQAVKIENSIAVIDTEKCNACGKCVAECPKNLIVVVPFRSNVRVACNSKDNGKITRSHCKVGCIGCKLCEKTCKLDAIHVNKFNAEIDYNKCVGCKQCVAKCPTKAIIVN